MLIRCQGEIPGLLTTYDIPQDPSFVSSYVISAFDGPSTAIANPPSPPSCVQTLNSAKMQKRYMQSTNRISYYMTV